MIRKLITILTVSAILLPSISFAESSPLYIGINAARFDSKYGTAEPDGGMMNFGVDLNNYFALEVAGGASRTYTDDATGATSKVDYVASAFLRFNIRFQRVTLYALGGYSKAKSTGTAGPITISTESDGGSIGYGMDFYGTRDLALSVRRVEFFDIDKNNEKTHLGATMVGITYYYDTPKIHSRY